MLSFLSTHWRNTVYSNVWIAMGAGLWVLSACLEFRNPGWMPALFAGSSTVFFYNFQRMVKLAQRPRIIVPGRNEWLYENRFWMLLWVIAGGTVASFTFFQLEIREQLVLLIPGGMALIYVFRILPGKKGPKALREVPGAKIFLIACSWAVACGLFPALHSEMTGWGIVMFTTERFLFILAITIPFDVRDLRYDHPGMRTLPQIMGIKPALRLAELLLALSGLFAAMAWYFELTSLGFLLASLIALIPAAWLVRQTLPDQPELFFTGKIDGLIALQALLQIGASFLSF